MCQKAVDQRSTPAPPSVCPWILTSHLLGNQMHCDASQARGYQGLPASHCQVLASWMPLSGIVLLETTPTTLIHCGKIKAECDFRREADALMPLWYVSQVAYVLLQCKCAFTGVCEDGGETCSFGKCWNRKFWAPTVSRGCYLLVNIGLGFKFLQSDFHTKFQIHNSFSFFIHGTTREKMSSPHSVLASLS